MKFPKLFVDSYAVLDARRGPWASSAFIRGEQNCLGKKPLRHSAAICGSPARHEAS